MYANLSVPYGLHLETPVEPGQTFVIKAKISDQIDKKSDESRVSFNLSSDSHGNNSGDLPLHISLRLDKNETVFNSRQNGQWGAEEKVKQPLKEGEQFSLRIRVHDDRYEIQMNGVAFHNFKHRAPLSHIKDVFIDGPIMLNNLTWGGQYYPVPYESRLDLPVGRRLLLSGTPKANGDRFAINLYSNALVALHFNARFKDHEVVRNTKQGESWGPEEKEGEMPFKKGVTFDMTIVNEQNGLQIYVNDTQFCTYSHRVSNNITAIGVEDAELQLVKVV